LPFFAATPEGQRNTVVHECLHCHADRVRGAFDDVVRDSHLLTQAVFDAAFNGMRRAGEEAVDGIAAAISKFFPLPPDPNQ